MPVRGTRRSYYEALRDALPERALVVTSLGNASYLWAAIHHMPENFYFEDAMGLTLPLALGLAIAQPNRSVIAFEGDGALLMHLGALVTIGAINPPNLTILLVQNGVHAASGGQALTNSNLDLANLAKAAGIAWADNLSDAKALGDAIRSGAKRQGVRFLVLDTEPDIEVVSPPISLDPVATKHRFMTAIEVPRYVPTLFGGGPGKS